MGKILVFISFNFLSLVPIIFWLFFFLWQDRKHPEPFKWLLGVYLSGFLIGPLIWFLETLFFKNVVLFDSSQIMQRGLWLCFGSAIIEESIKFLMVYLIVKRNTFCDEYLDPSIYLVTGALGFASLENLIAVFSFATNKTNFLDLLSLLGGRFLGANFLHAILAVIIGVAWGWGVKHNYSSHKLTKLIFLGLSSAVVIHTIFNYSLIAFRESLIIPFGGFLFMLAIIFLWLLQALEGRSKNLENHDFYR